MIRFMIKLLGLHGKRHLVAEQRRIDNVDGMDV